MKPLGLALVALVSALGLGCNAISGIEDFHVGTADDRDAIVSESDTIDAGSIDTGERPREDAPPDTAPVIESGTDTIDADCPTHSNGLGGSYVDCAPLATPGVASTYSIDLASKARGAWLIALSGGDQETACGDGSKLLFRYSSTQTAAWAYSGPMVGHVHIQPAGGPPYCPTLTDPTWN